MTLKDFVQVLVTLRVCFIEKRGNKQCSAINVHFFRGIQEFFQEQQHQHVSRSLAVKNN